MKHVSQTLELAIKLLDKDPCYAHYICVHLDWMNVQEYITEEELADARAVVIEAIGNEVTLAGYLRTKKLMPHNISVHSAEYRPYQVKFYRDLIAKLRADDPMFLIIEAAYHCGFAHEQIHEQIAEAGLPETSDETIAYLLGNYAESIKEE